MFFQYRFDNSLVLCGNIKHSPTTEVWKLYKAGTTDQPSSDLRTPHQTYIILYILLQNPKMLIQPEVQKYVTSNFLSTAQQACLFPITTPTLWKGLKVGSHVDVEPPSHMHNWPFWRGNSGVKNT